MTLDDLKRAAEALPRGASITLTAGDLIDALASAAPQGLAVADESWRSRLWTVPDDTRMSVDDVMEALGRPKSYVYRAVAKDKGAHRFPALRFGGELSFRAGAVREWVERESVAAFLGITLGISARDCPKPPTIAQERTIAA